MLDITFLLFCDIKESFSLSWSPDEDNKSCRSNLKLVISPTPVTVISSCDSIVEYIQSSLGTKF